MYSPTLWGEHGCAQGDDRAGWITAFLSSFNLFSFPLQKKKKRLWVRHRSFWFCCTLENVIHGALKKQTVLLYFSLGEGKWPRVWRVLRGPCKQSQPHRTMSKSPQLYGFQESAGPSPLPGASLTWRNSQRTRDRQSGANHSSWPPSPFRQILNVK